MIHYDPKFNAAIRLLRDSLTTNHFDLLVRELKLPSTYFEEPGFVYANEIFQKRLQTLPLKYQLMLQLFCLKTAIPLADVYSHLLPKTAVEELTALGIFTIQDDLLRTDSYGIVPFLGHYFIATFGAARGIGAYIGRQSYLLSTSILQQHAESFLDLGTGCGILAILAARAAKIVAGVDIMPEAIEVAKTNAVLNNVETRAEFYCGDMYQPVVDRHFQAIVANVPFMALPARYRELVAVSSGEDGLDFIRHFLNGMVTFTPQRATIIANGLGSESEPLLLRLLNTYPLQQQGYQAHLLIYSKSLLEDIFISNSAKMVESIYRDKGEVLSMATITEEINKLYQHLGVDYVYGIILELTRTQTPTIEVLDISNRYTRNMVPYFNYTIELHTQPEWKLHTHTGSLILNPRQKEMVEAIRDNTPLLPDHNTLDFYNKIEWLLEVKKRS